MATRAPRPAESGDLEQEVVAALRIFDRFVSERQRRLTSVTGGLPHGAAARGAIMRRVLLASSDGRQASMAECIRAAEPWTSRWSVTNEIERLRVAGLIEVEGQRRGQRVIPTPKLLAFGRDQVRALRALARDVCAAMGTSRPSE